MDELVDSFFALATQEDGRREMSVALWRRFADQVDRIAAVAPHATLRELECLARFLDRGGDRALGRELRRIATGLRHKAQRAWHARAQLGAARDEARRRDARRLLDGIPRCGP